jgi:hypothetical protein
MNLLHFSFYLFSPLLWLWEYIYDNVISDELEMTTIHPKITVIERRNRENLFLINKYIKTIVFFVAVYTDLFLFDDRRD